MNVLKLSRYIQGAHLPESCQDLNRLQCGVHSFTHQNANICIQLCKYTFKNTSPYLATPKYVFTQVYTL